MLEKTNIQKSCIIEQHRIVVDDKLIWSSEPEVSFSNFSKEAFHHLDIDYPKFYKMDALSKLAFLAAEYILQGEDTGELALVLTSKSGSLDTDLKHQQSIRDSEYFYPRPATFVYTLPNICAGEICIRHGLQTENAFFIAEEFPEKTIFAYADYLLQSNKAKRVLCGWVEYFQEKYRAFLYIF
ncbi:3-oxoacyl-ACP synthase [Sphingobacterium phlebotomi]|uniref:3-oxoacyl-ACP synthase n=1 Tax=Sphingobacterium phlebotomi TaxID=2605433 RepID=A0A5D4HAA6_9SPHI|nr:3-oxoacyl-ACP synthase [Sphingobacterium phlebotomi]TYR37716.1 3-oxoacyl-ACP synthase [Sphingobacterium phlebotomi]